MTSTADTHNWTVWAEVGGQGHSDCALAAAVFLNRLFLICQTTSADNKVYVRTLPRTATSTKAGRWWAVVAELMPRRPQSSSETECMYSSKESGIIESTLIRRLTAKILIAAGKKWAVMAVPMPRPLRSSSERACICSSKDLVESNLRQFDRPTVTISIEAGKK